jgi:NAD-dependent deacetylase
VSRDAADALAAHLAKARRILPFTGAGISTESGVPDFRTPGSPWLIHKPIPFDAFVAHEAVRGEAWRRKFAMDDHMRGARPNRGHAAVAALVRSGRAEAVVTQNIDNLHQDAGLGVDEVVELHGNGTYAACIACGRRRELAEIRPVFEATGRPPVCEGCGGPVKSATVSFGQSMPEAQLRRARRLAEGCDLFLAIGSSLVVYPAAALPLVAKEAGATLVILNRDPTPLDGAADLVLRAEIGAVLEAATARLDVDDPGGHG